MDVNFTINDRGLSKRLNTATRDFPNEVKSTVKKATTLMWQKTFETTPSAFGDLRRSLSAKVLGYEGVVRPTVKYAIYVHEGTKPHWVPHREWADSSGSINRWARQKGINPFLVARSIARKGTKARPWMRDAFNANQGEVKRMFEEMIQNTVNKMAG